MFSTLPYKRTYKPMTLRLKRELAKLKKKKNNLQHKDTYLDSHTYVHKCT